MNFAELRQKMVREQLVRRGIRDPEVLRAMATVPRELFVPPHLQYVAYDDCPQPIGENQTISQPYMVALMTECLKLKGKEKVLEVGCGSGYQAAILAEIGCEVYSIERIATLAERASEVLRSLGYRVRVRVGDGSLGWPDEAPFERIIVTAAAPYVPEKLKGELADGGIMVVPVGSRYSQELVTVRRRGGVFVEEEGPPCVFVKLVGKNGWPEELPQS